ncbi:hypothetical protein [Qipengyuania nanhaisediminis]|uniref:hypothetical protein n=1 Tax=Qipengyuania nanhaisediminis TaxID=604088 RepID=UPI0038B3DF64
MFAKSRFNPAPGAVDFWNEFRKPNPYRWPILAVSALPLAVIFYWLSTETVYKTPERPRVTYITTFDPERTDNEIIQSNLENQELKELREQAEADLAARKREIYKALGAGIGMDVEEIERRAEEERAAEAAAEEARRAEMFGRPPSGESGAETSSESTAP